MPSPRRKASAGPRRIRVDAAPIRVEARVPRP